MSGIQPIVREDDASEPDTSLPTTRERMRLVKLHAGNAKVETDSLGKMRVDYTKEGSSQSAQTDQGGKSDDDIPDKLKAFLDVVKFAKKNFVLLDESAVTPGASGKYLEGVDFKYVEEILGRGSMSGDIMVAIDNVTETKHAVKKIMVTIFHENEIQVWCRLKDSDSFPKLYCLRKEGNGVFIHMEPIEGITLQKILDEHMATLREEHPGLVRPFSLWVFHDLLSVVKKIHDKNWAHGDLNPGNIMLTKDTMSVKVLDFGCAKQLEGNFELPVGGPDASCQNDILELIKITCGLHCCKSSYDFNHLKKMIENGTLSEELATQSVESREETMQLIMMAYEVAQLSNNQEGYRNTTPVMKKIKEDMRKENHNHDEVLMKVAAILFPQFREGDRELHSQEEEVADAADVASDGQGDSGDAAAAPLADLWLNWRI